MKKILSLLFLALLLSPQLFAGIPIKDVPAENVANAEIRELNVQKKGKWKQKLAKKILAKKADIGENRTAAIVFAVLIPFVGVAIFQDGITKDFWITLLLTCCLILPGIIYALSIVLKRY